MTRQEFIKLIEEEGKPIYSFCYGLTGRREEADDLYQETMLKAMECCERIDEHLGSPKSFLMGIAAKSWKNRKKKYARRQRIAPEESVDDERYFGEIAESLQLPKGTVKSRLHTARTIIGKKLEEHGYER